MGERTNRNRQHRLSDLGDYVSDCGPRVVTTANKLSVKKGVKGGAIIWIILFFFTIVLEFHFKTFVSQEMLVELVSGGLLVPISYQT